MEYSKELYNIISKRFGIIGTSRPVIEAVNTLIKSAPTDLSILITGETGTGKEVFAKAIHGLSNRSKMPFLSVNCAAIPENLLESELFGHEKGSFTGAIEQRIGYFESANNGTIFLDEIGEMPLLTQVKLLRVLESGEFSRIGSSSMKKVNVRVIAATNRNLEAGVENGNFRRDLFFRLRNVHIELPSLREHLEDIPLLVNHFGNSTATKLGMKFIGMDDDATQIFKSLHWSGNIRELKNLVETIITLEKTDFITASNLKKYIPAALPAYKSTPVEQNMSLVSIPKQSEGFSAELGIIFKTLLEIKSEVSELKYGLNHLHGLIEDVKLNTSHLQYEDLEEIPSQEKAMEYLETLSLEDIEKRIISHVLNRFDGNRRLVAQSLGISERTLYRKIHQYDL